MENFLVVIIKVIVVSNYLTGTLCSKKTLVSDFNGS